ncbi:protein trapped in endoderm-1-like [Amphibalanus amphitrite]|uniref:protein trapped in endoderm-1-like n=1 Tax=Amphibalanus amphitrite TaxID=1232801 RepID=UPI001C90BDD3|nr:protein trapped in endoderm-1-like [Amphibalanus amphitrite]
MEANSTAAAARLPGGGGTLNHTGPGPDPAQVHYPRAATVTAAVCCVIFIVVGVIGNLLTLIVLRQSLRMPGRLSTAATLFLLSLCVSDLLFCAINLPLTASRYINEAWVLGDVACRLFPFFFYGNVAASLLSMTAIAINRYILICHKHLHGKVYRLRNIAVMVACIWICSFGPLLLPLTDVWGQMGLRKRTFSCTILPKNGSSPKKAVFVAGILVPCLLIAACYLMIYCKATRERITTGRSSMPASCSVQSINRKPSSRREDYRLTGMMVTVFVAFVVCFVPLMLVNIFDSNDTRVPTLHVLASVLAWLSAVINPVIYAGSSRYYRAIYRQLVCGDRGSSGQGAAPSEGGADSPALHWEAAEVRLTDDA